MLNILSEALTWLFRPGVRRFVWIPLLINVVALSTATWAFFHYLSVVLDNYLPAGSWLDYLRWLVWPILVVVFALISFYSFGLLANIIAAPFNGYLAAAVERIETGVQPESGMTMVQEIWQSISQELRKSLFFVVWLIPLIILSFIPVLNLISPLLWFLYSAWVNYLQYMDYPMANHGMRFAEQRAILRGKPIDMFTFGGITTVVMMIPLVNLFAIPVMVIAATLYWCRHIRHRSNC